ncbi:peptidylprolyl isomerase [Desulfocarbo indianensis]|nr:peptidylprolyl isomerase [Desulfocarbo indianensis]
MPQAKQGDKVQIHYTGKFPDGTVFDSSQGGQPLEFTAGGADLIPGVSQAVVGMAPGETKTVEIAPADGYGQRQEGMEQKVAREMLPPQVKEGDPLQAQAGDQTIVVWVKELGEQEAVLDANHPLAGKTLVFDLEMVSIIPA